MTSLQPCIFLDRDGVINVERGTYTWRAEDYRIVPGVPEALARLKAAGYLLVVITNQAGIAKGLYTHADVLRCHDYTQQQCGQLIDGLYYSPYHPVQSESLGRKPGRLLFEKAIAKYSIDPGRSWMVGDKERDLIPAAALGIGQILITAAQQDLPYPQAPNLLAATEYILAQSDR